MSKSRDKKEVFVVDILSHHDEKNQLDINGLPECSLLFFWACNVKGWLSEHCRFEGTLRRFFEQGACNVLAPPYALMLNLKSNLKNNDETDFTAEFFDELWEQLQKRLNDASNKSEKRVFLPPIITNAIRNVREDRSCGEPWEYPLYWGNMALYGCGFLALPSHYEYKGVSI